MRASVLHGDCRVVMAELRGRGFRADTIVTDPPYELGFMGRTWDRGGIAFDPAVWRLCYEVLPPGGVMLAFGGSRTFHRIWCAIEDAGFFVADTVLWLYGQGFPKSKALLKPAFEPIVVARKPGPLREWNIEACRVHAEDAKAGRTRHGGGAAFAEGMSGFKQDVITTSPAGRWPANVTHDGSDEVLEAFAAFGERRSGKPSGIRNVRSATSGQAVAGGLVTGFGDTGSAARFYYCAKASKRERVGKHPCQKPQALMRWLCRLVTPPGGLVLDPFAGSGSTLQAAVAEGFHALGIEQEAEYVADSWRRLGREDIARYPEAAE